MTPNRFPFISRSCSRYMIAAPNAIPNSATPSTAEMMWSVTEGWRSVSGGSSGWPGVPPETVRHPTVTLHVMTAVLGVALFAIAFGAALMYLLQEREVKGKHFGALFSRLPSLDALDRMVQRLVRAGFVAYTVALIAGTLTATSVWKSAWSWDPQQVVSVCVWFLYAAMVHLRHSGWHGRRYAVLTLVGFVIVLGSMVSLRTIPGFTRHSGDYGARTTQGGAQ